jgi:hypothetical protein
MAAFAKMTDIGLRAKGRPPIPASSLLPFVTEYRCGSFCRPTWRRLEGEYATISITSGPVSGRISDPESAVFPDPYYLKACQHAALCRPVLHTGIDIGQIRFAAVRQYYVDFVAAWRNPKWLRSNG